jgi:hypothetical protein
MDRLDPIYQQLLDQNIVFLVLGQKEWLFRRGLDLGIGLRI